MAKTANTDEVQLQKTASQLNLEDWTPQLDKILQDCVVKSQFNFDLVAVEVTTAAEASGKGTASEGVGAFNSFTSHMCRLRWSYIHLMRKANKTISYDPKDLKQQQLAA